MLSWADKHQEEALGIAIGVAEHRRAAEEAAGGIVELALKPPRRRITDRDLEVLEFVARFGLVPGGAAARWAGTSRSVTYRREARWREHGLVRVAALGGRVRAAARPAPVRDCMRSARKGSAPLACRSVGSGTRRPWRGSPRSWSGWASGCSASWRSWRSRAGRGAALLGRTLRRPLPPARPRPGRGKDRGRGRTDPEGELAPRLDHAGMALGDRRGSPRRGPLPLLASELFERSASRSSAPAPRS